MAELRSNELPEFPTRGTFGGIQSEVPPDIIEQYGFSEAENVIFRKGAAYSRSRIDDLSTLPDPIVGVADFFTLAGDRKQVIFTTTGMYTWNNLTADWDQVTGVLTGSIKDLVTADCVGGKLFFSQGIDKVKMWDGSTPGFADAALAAVPAKFLFELGFHLMACYTLESGNAAPQRVRWTGSGDGTDWTSFNSGQIDLFNNLGPITGGVKLFQQGYVFQQWGITQVQLTGQGLNPFYFQPLGSKAKGNIAPYSLASFGEDIACYIGKNDIYRFDGAYSTPIGSAPVDGNRRIGARRRIFADLSQCDLRTVFGLISTSINSNDYSAYWIFMPELKQAWVYHFDEANWTRFTFARTPTRAGEFNKDSLIRIMDLVGSINDQAWVPALLVNNNPLDSLLLAFTNDSGSDGEPAEFAFTGPSERNVLLRSGQCCFGDFRHEHTIKKFRINIHDQGPVDFTMKVTNERGQEQIQKFTMGTSSGYAVSNVIEFSMPGKFLIWELTVPAGQQMAVSEVTPVFSVGGEIRRS